MISSCISYQNIIINKSTSIIPVNLDIKVSVILLDAAPNQIQCTSVCVCRPQECLRTMSKIAKPGGGGQQDQKKVRTHTILYQSTALSVTHTHSALACQLAATCIAGEGDHYHYHGLYRYLVSFTRLVTRSSMHMHAPWNDSSLDVTNWFLSNVRYCNIMLAVVSIADHINMECLCSTRHTHTHSHPEYCRCEVNPLDLQMQ